MTDEDIEICEGCEKKLRPGNLGCVCEDGPIFCEACAPTWNELAEQYREPGLEHDEDGLTLETIEAHIAAGDGDKKHVWPL